LPSPCSRGGAATCEGTTGPVSAVGDALDADVVDTAVATAPAFDAGVVPDSATIVGRAAAVEPSFVGAFIVFEEALPPVAVGATVDCTLDVFPQAVVASRARKRE
jgi:hypothetical protein